MNMRYTVVGGDDRQAYLANLLTRDGHQVICSGMENSTIVSREIKAKPLPEAVLAADIVVLPLPATRDGVTINANNSYTRLYLAEVFDNLQDGVIAVGGMLDGKLTEAAEARGIVIYDYLKREEMSILNAIPTAEGALEIAIRETDFTLHSSKCLVSGYGRIGKILSKMLMDLGADVTVSARKCADLAWIKQAGCRAVHISGIFAEEKEYDIIFNTVPDVIFDRHALSKITNKESVLIIDLASDPGGIDIEAAGTMGIKSIRALSLPGKVAPKTAAAIIRDTIYNIVQEDKNG